MLKYKDMENTNTLFGMIPISAIWHNIPPPPCCRTPENKGGGILGSLLDPQVSQLRSPKTRGKF